MEINSISESVFVDLLKDYKTVLYRMAFVYMQNETDALEMVSETIYKCYKHKKTLKDTRYFKTWITRILINICLTSLKKRKKQTQIPYDEHYIDKSVNRNFEINLEDNILLSEALATLRTEYKTCLMLRFYQDLSLNETAKIMNLPAGTVKTYTKRALEQLRLVLKEEDFFYE